MTIQEQQQDFWHLVNRQIDDYLAVNGAKLVAALVTNVGANGFVNVRRNGETAADGIYYPVVNPAYKPLVGQWVWCLTYGQDLIVLGRNTQAGDQDIASVANSGSGVYLPLAGGTMTGGVSFGGPANSLDQPGPAYLQLSGSRGTVLVGPDLGLASNAYFNGTSWLRRDTTLAASLMVLDRGNGRCNVYSAPAGANPITWTPGGLTALMPDVDAIRPVGHCWVTASAGNANVPFNTNTKAALNTVQSNPDAWFNTTSLQYVAKKAGFVRLDAGLYVQNTNTGNLYAMGIAKNNVIHWVSQHLVGAINAIMLAGSRVFPCAVNDAFEVFFYHNHNLTAGSAALPDIVSGVQFSYLSGNWIGA